MKFLSVRQPWVYAIFHLGKGVENRPRNTSHRGPLGIHASRTFDDAGEAWLLDQGFDVPDREVLPMGGLVGTVRLINVIPESDKHLITPEDRKWFFGPFGYMLDSPAPCEFVPWRGQLGFFQVPDAFLKQREAA